MMEALFVCYPKCSTCQKAKKFLMDKGVSYTERDIKRNNPTKEEICTWQAKSGLPMKKFFNTSGILYREMQLSKKLGEMTDDEMAALLATDGMLVKRPILVLEKKVLVGFKPGEWEEI